MKPYLLILFCLFLTGCGVFDLNVRTLPNLTATAQAAITRFPMPHASPTPLIVTPTTAATATTLAQTEPTAVILQAGQALKLLNIRMNNSRQGWAVESLGHIIRSNDGGVSWMNVSPAKGPFDIHGLFVFNSETVWAVPPHLDMNNMIWRTQDGGQTWDPSQPLELGDGHYSPLSIQFPNARDGWLLVLARGESQGSHVLLYKSGDGGENWGLVNSLANSLWQSYLPNTNTSMAFFDGQTGWLGGWWGKDHPNQWTVLKTVDGGATWQTEALSTPTGDSLTCDGHAVTALPPGQMAMDMTCTQASNPQYLYHQLYYLAAGGPPTWRAWNVPGRFLGMDFRNSSVGWMLVGPGTTLNEIHRTLDGGKTWTNINIVAWKEARFDFIVGGEGWAIVSDGSAEALVHTVDGGLTWEEIKPVVANP